MAHVLTRNVEPTGGAPNVRRTDGMAVQPLMVSAEAYLHASTRGMFRYRSSLGAPHCWKEVNETVKALSLEGGLEVIFAERSEMCELQLFERLQSLAFHPGTVQFVLIFVNADGQLHGSTQDKLMKWLPNMQACYTNNLAHTARPDVFYPMPLGLASHHWAPYNRVVYEPVLRRFRAISLPWSGRSSKVLMYAGEARVHSPGGPSRKPTRLKLLKHLSSAEFAALVDPVFERVKFEQVLQKTGEHRFVLSPPGVGYDAFRTWETLAMGSIPVVVVLPWMDQRLFDGFPVVRLPHNFSKITPSYLGQLLEEAKAPKEPIPGLYVTHWQNRWWEHLQDRRRRNRATERHALRSNIQNPMHKSAR